MTLEELIDCNKACNGFALPYEEFDKKKIDEIKRILPKLREKISNIFKRERYKEKYYPLVSRYMLFRGSRYNSDEDIICRMRSVKDSVYKNDLEGLCLDALVDAMQADYWYTYEKDYK